MKRLRGILKRLGKTVKYSASNPENFEEIWSFQTSRIRLISLILVVFALVGFLAVYLFSSGLLSGYVKGSDIKRTQLEEQRVRIDELTNKMEYQEAYINNIRRVLSGEIPIDLVSDTLVNLPEIDLDTLQTNPTNAEKRLSREVNNDMSTPVTNRDITLRYFGSPALGVVSQGFDATKHPGIDVVTTPGFTVKSCLGGTVLYAGYSRLDGYIMIIGHPGNFVSVYKHNKTLLKKSGDIVRLGDPIAIVGNTGENTDGPHLHFELWYNQTPVDPAKYISFTR